MATSEKLSSKSQQIENKDVDLLTDVLPEHVVSHILSLLSTKEAVKTSVLSKRWRFLWTTISNLDFFDKCTLPCSSDNFTNSYANDNFKKSVNSVLLQLGPNYSINKFHLSVKQYKDFLEIKKWISFAVERKVKDLTLSLETYAYDNCMDAPCDVFECKSVRLFHGLHLKIQQQGFVCFPNLQFLTLERVTISLIPAAENSPCFPKLKTLCLKEITYGKDDSVMKLIRNCPLLEDLSISRRIDHDVSNDDMCIPQLSSADLMCQLGSFGKNLNVRIEAPVKNLTISNWNPTSKIIVKNRDSLLRAKLEFDLPASYHYLGEQREELLKLINTVDKVKCLSLSVYVIDAIITTNIRLPLFSNLIRLEVKLSCTNLYMLKFLLNKTIHLQSLVIHKKYAEGCTAQKEECVKENGRWTELSDVPKCLLSSLKSVDIVNSFDCPGDLEMIKNMLEFAEVLEVVSRKPFWYHESRHTTDDLRRKISAFPRASASCQFHFPS